jgi:hypothetical protein
MGFTPSTPNPTPFRISRKSGPNSVAGIRSAAMEIMEAALAVARYTGNWNRAANGKKCRAMTSDMAGGNRSPRPK